MGTDTRTDPASGSRPGWLLRDGKVLASLEIPDRHRHRARGLLGRDGFEGAMLLRRCRSVHTLGMRFRLEVRFLDEAACELRVVAEVPPNRLVCHRGAAAVLERRCATSKRDCA